MFGISNQFLNNLLFWISRKKWLIATFFISITTFYLPTPDGLSAEGHRTLIIVVTALILIISESIPIQPGIPDELSATNHSLILT